MQTWPLFGPKLFDAFMALGTFEPAVCLPTTAAAKATMPGGFANGCNCGDIPLEDTGKKLLLSYTVPAGEGSKCRDVKAAIEDFMVCSYQPSRPLPVSPVLTNVFVTSCDSWRTAATAIPA